MRLSTEAVSVTERIRESGGVKSRDEEESRYAFARNVLKRGSFSRSFSKNRIGM
jgi:hypothetical protein